MKTYFLKLRNHPGVPVAVFLTVAFIFAGASRPDGAWWIGVIAAMAPWSIVLWTARTQPLHGDHE